MSFHVFIGSSFLFLILNEQKVIFFFIPQVDDNLLQISFIEIVFCILKLVIVFFCFPSIVNFLQLLSVIKLRFKLRLGSMFPVNPLLENAIYNFLYLIVWRKICICKSEDWHPFSVHCVPYFFESLRLYDFISSISFVWIELSFIIFIIVIVLFGTVDS